MLSLERNWGEPFAPKPRGLRCSPFPDLHFTRAAASVAGPSLAAADFSAFSARFRADPRLWGAGAAGSRGVRRAAERLNTFRGPFPPKASLLYRAAKLVRMVQRAQLDGTPRRRRQKATRHTTLMNKIRDPVPRRNVPHQKELDLKEFYGAFGVYLKLKTGT